MIDFALSELESVANGPEGSYHVLAGPKNGALGIEKDRVVNWITTSWSYLNSLKPYLPADLARELDQTRKARNDLGYDDINANVPVPAQETEKVKMLISGAIKDLTA